jgi:dihydroorotate dehydrogenase
MFQLYRKFQEDAGKYRVFLSSGYAIINTDLLIKLNRYKKPIYSSNKPKEYPINAYYDDNVINKDIKENLKNNWKSKPNKKSGLENNGEHISCPIISSMVTVTCFWENMDTK